jgi:ActR/RegA family two-component response regulator
VLTSRGWDVTGVAGTAETGARLVQQTAPDVAVVDLHLASEGGGDALIRRLAESSASTKLVVFTELIEGLEAVSGGRRFLSPRFRSALH